MPLHLKEQVPAQRTIQRKEEDILLGIRSILSETLKASASLPNRLATTWCNVSSVKVASKPWFTADLVTVMHGSPCRCRSQWCAPQSLKNRRRHNGSITILPNMNVLPSNSLRFLNVYFVYEKCLRNTGCEDKGGYQS